MECWRRGEREGHALVNSLDRHLTSHDINLLVLVPVQPKSVRGVGVCETLPIAWSEEGSLTKQERDCGRMPFREHVNGGFERLVVEHHRCHIPKEDPGLGEVGNAPDAVGDELLPRVFRHGDCLNAVIQASVTRSASSRHAPKTEAAADDSGAPRQSARTGWRSACFGISIFRVGPAAVVNCDVALQFWISGHWFRCRCAWIVPESCLADWRIAPQRPDTVPGTLPTHVTAHVKVEP